MPEQGVGIADVGRTAVTDLSGERCRDPVGTAIVRRLKVDHARGGADPNDGVSLIAGRGGLTDLNRRVLPCAGVGEAGGVEIDDRCGRAGPEHA